MKHSTKQVKADEELMNTGSPNSIIGTFEGECADSNITNLNGMDITYDVWDTLFKSDDYKTGIELGHYIGFLGHPEDVNDQNYKNGCIVMREGHIDENGIVTGKFDLIDTPVGRVVKSFIDAGVKFGISVRGAGDLIDNSVDPDTFVFRGFDLVTFPAYPNSIPEFTALAASSDAKTQKRYKIMCSALNKELSEITSVESLKVLMSSFAPQSEQHKAIEARIQELSPEEDPSDPRDSKTGEEIITEEEINIDAEKIACMTKLYAQAIKANQELKSENAALRQQIKSSKSAASRKLEAVDRIMSSQVAKLQASVHTERMKRTTIQASVSKLKDENVRLGRDNLKYHQEVKASIAEKDATISQLQRRLNETVIEASTMKERSSNLDEKIDKLKAQVTATTRLLESYQDAYVDLYATALGVQVDKLTISASTSVDELRSLIKKEHRSPIVASTGVPLTSEGLEFDYPEGADDDDGELITT